MSLPLWWTEIEQQLKSDRTITNILGRKIHFKNVINDELIRKAIAFIPQSTVGDTVNRSLIKIYQDETNKAIYDVDILAQIHDSILYQYQLDNFKNMASSIHQCRDYMTETFKARGREFTIETDMSCGLSWGAFSERTNPIGMQEIAIVDNLTEQADRLEAYYNGAKA